MLVLLEIGKNFERLNRWKFLTVYLGSLSLSSLTLASVFVLQHNSDDFVGASGGILGLVGAYGVLLASTKRTSEGKGAAGLYLLAILSQIGFDSIVHQSSRTGHLPDLLQESFYGWDIAPSKRGTAKHGLAIKARPQSATTQEQPTSD